MNKKIKPQGAGDFYWYQNLDCQDGRWACSRCDNWYEKCECVEGQLELDEEMTEEMHLPIAEDTPICPIVCIKCKHEVSRDHNFFLCERKAS
jgi:hypothetical protein